MISLVQFEDKDGNNLSEVLQVPSEINLEQLKGLISTDKNLYINGNLITVSLENSLSKSDLADTEKINKIKLSDDEKSTQPAVYCSSSYSGHEGPVLKVKFCNDILVTAGGDKTVRFWDMLTKTQFKIVSQHNHWAMHIQSNGHIFSGGMDSLINIYDFSGNFLKSISKQKKGISCLKFESGILVSGARDGTVVIFKIGENLNVEILQKWAHLTPITAICVSNDFVASGSKDGIMKVYKRDCDKFSYFGDLKGHTSQINSIESTGNYIVSGEDSGQIIIWKDFAVKTRLIHKREVISIAISPNGINFVSGSFDKTVKIWNIETGALLGSYFHVGFVYKVAFYNDLVVSCSKDKTIRMYRVSKGKCISDLVVDDEVYDFDYKDGHLVAGLKNSKVYFFN